ncbi:aminotransferase class III-fold pyridoxal phosphate-dependent enzyme [Metasolibacillus sp. FSL H7-0170]|uniref:aspartate aminotransferase family protein n=1 Tax=Metasolibacillus TaxID=2703677 RepID=UPI0007935A83|nr:aminotransferase class III-fold pyridoxal phosphate-dependent enzyme [Metasolibacillus fluoroglycofenilyticus]KYG90545.1 hypothetical protein A0U40_06115 [[Bacillus] sp. KCTC 13219]
MSLQLSRKMYEEMRNYSPSGVNSNSRFVAPHPTYYKKGNGAYLTDLDGNEYLDIVLGNGAIILGHNHKKFMEKYHANLESGIITGVETPLSVKVAKKFLEFVPTAEQVRFSNTGTEAVLHAIMMARSYTNKQDVAVVEGAYNGWSDVVNVSTWADLSQAGEADKPNPLPGSTGLNQKIVESTVVIPFNNIEATQKIIEENHERLAALVLEPTLIDIGYISGNIEFLKAVRELCTKYNIVLIFDELLTGFRESEGGYQKRIGVTPDLSTFGKAIANGFPLSAVAGKKEIMQIAEAKPGGYAFVGTYNGHQSSLAAALAFFEVYEEENVLQKLDERTERLIKFFNSKASELNIDAHMVGKGGHIHWYFTKEKPTNYREAAHGNAEQYIAFIQSMQGDQLYCLAKPLSHHAISLAHEDKELTILEAAMEKALKQVAKI